MLPVSEMFYEVQGEGAQTGRPCVFIRLAGCNLQCAADGEAGFDCDTELLAKASMTEEEIVAEATRMAAPAPLLNVIVTGGEPTLHDLEPLLKLLKQAAPRSVGVWIGLETNGTQLIKGDCLHLLNWISCSPKTAEHTIRVQRVDEFRYVRNADQPLPVMPQHPGALRYLSPAFAPDGSLPRANLDHCIALVKGSPKWRLSLQTHKLIGHR